MRKMPSRWVTSSGSTSTAKRCASGGIIQVAPMLERKKTRKQGAIRTLKGFILEALNRSGMKKKDRKARSSHSRSILLI